MGEGRVKKVKNRNASLHNVLFPFLFINAQTRETIRDHLAKMAELPNPPNADLSQGFTVSQVASLKKVNDIRVVILEDFLEK